MKKKIVLIVFLSASVYAHSQVEVAKLLGDKGKDYQIGYGAFLKLAIPATETSDITVEAGLLLWLLKDGSGDGMAVVPIKAGYRYCFDGTGYGFYAEPQIGYNVYGIESDTKFNGFVWSAGAGYLFAPSGKIQFDIGIRYESIVLNGGSLNYIGLRLSHNFSFRRRGE